MLDSPWKIAALIGALVFLRLLVGVLKESSQRAFFAELINSALIAFALVFLLIRPYLLQAFYIPSGSMEPTLHEPDKFTGRPGDRILVNKFIYLLSEPRRGDIIVFKAPPQALALEAQDSGTDYIKRVIGLPGDRVQVRQDDGVYINGKRLTEPYIQERAHYDWPTNDFSGNPTKPYLVPKGCLFVMGDNRNNSSDSRVWRDPSTGEAKPALPLANVQGKSLIIFWPPDRIGHLTH